jgi:mannose-1-phosphate guanylyltransferase
MNNPHTYSVIMAGGIGSRFWPMSRTKNPKQFLDILGIGRTLLQQTFDRLLHSCPVENIYVVTNEEYRQLVLEQLPEIGEHQLLLEPARRNTAPCIAYACYKISQKDPEANIIIASSDHYIQKEDEFTACIKKAIEYCDSTNSLVTLGIQPNRPDTGYGYIQFENSTDGEVKKVKTFTEKPSLEIAQEFLNSGDFLWNSGIFIWSARSITLAFERHLPEMAQAFSEGNDLYYTDAEKDFIEQVYPTCQNISIDYGIMEKADNVYVLPADFGWSDLGTWGSLYANVPLDNEDNALLGKNIKAYESRGNLVYAERNKLIVLQGINDLVIVDKGNVLLICHKDHEQEIKQIVTDIKMEKGEDFV